MQKKSPWLSLTAILLVLALAFMACELPVGGAPRTPGAGEPGQIEPAPEQPVEVPPEPAPEEPIEAPPEPAPEEPIEAPPEPEPTKEPVVPEAPAEPPAPEAPAEPPAPAPEQPPPDSGGETTSEGDLLKIFIVLVIILLILGVIMMIVGALGGGGKSQAPAQAPAAEAPPAPQTVEDHLAIATPKAAELYNRFNELVQTFGQVSITPTQTRIDFRVRAIFASVEFREDSLLALLVLPERLESPRIIRIDTYTQSSYANYTYIRTVEDYDAEFNAWLQEAYNLGARGI